MKKLIALGAVAVMTAAVPVVAHHAFGGEFDPNRPLLLKGKIVKLEWVNPHTWIHIEIPAGSVKGLETGEPSKPCQFTPNAKCDEWMVEGGTPNTLLRRGITKESLLTGTELVVDGYQARDHSVNRANGRNITYPDGKKLFLGSSGTGAPLDGADPTEGRGRGRGGR
jgi:Family of unknown function (DUF6152)